MDAKRFFWGLVLCAALVLASACGQRLASPTQPPTEETSAPEAVRAARDAALASFVKQAGADAPTPGLQWKEERITPPGLVGAETYRFTSGDWNVTVGYAVVLSSLVHYRVQVSNAPRAVEWQARVDAAGHVAVAPEAVLAARDNALAEIRVKYADEAPSQELTWVEQRTTPQGVLGSETYEYSSGDWKVTVSYVLVAPENMEYRVTVGNAQSGFRWQGKVSPQGEVSETAP
jgi:hypothetical protein